MRAVKCCCDCCLMEVIAECKIDLVQTRQVGVTPGPPGVCLYRVTIHLFHNVVDLSTASRHHHSYEGCMYNLEGVVMIPVSDIVVVVLDRRPQRHRERERSRTLSCPGYTATKIWSVYSLLERLSVIRTCLADVDGFHRWKSDFVERYSNADDGETWDLAGSWRARPEPPKYCQYNVSIEGSV